MAEKRKGDLLDRVDALICRHPAAFYETAQRRTFDQIFHQPRVAARFQNQPANARNARMFDAPDAAAISVRAVSIANSLCAG